MSAAAERFFVKHNALPTMPEVAARLLKSFDDDNVGLSQIAGLIENDSSLTAKVLRLDRATFWRHSVATANYARILARVLGADDATTDTAYLAGLMLRTGQL